jgi:hypothetical protein
MTYTEQEEMIERMEKYGGSFVKAIAAAFRCADRKNFAILMDAFPHYVEKYGPNSVHIKTTV